MDAEFLKKKKRRHSSMRIVYKMGEQKIPHEQVFLNTIILSTASKFFQNGRKNNSFPSKPSHIQREQVIF